MSKENAKSAKTKNTGPYKNAEKREAIIRAAHELFRAQGLKGSSMEQVAKAAGVAKQTIYSHFKNKEALFAAVAPARVEDSGMKSDAPDFYGARPDEILLDIGKKFFALATAPDVIAMNRLVISEARDYPKVAELFYENGPRFSLLRLSKVLEQLQAQGHLIEMDCVQAAIDLRNLLVGNYRELLLFQRITEVSPQQAEQQVRHAVAVFLRMYNNSVC